MEVYIANYLKYRLFQTFNNRKIQPFIGFRFRSKSFILNKKKI